MSRRLLPPEQKVIRRIAQRYEYLLRSEFRTAARNSYSQVDLATLVALLEEPSPVLGRIYTAAQVETLIGTFEINIRPLIAKVLLKMGETGIPVFARTFQVPITDINVYKRLAAEATELIIDTAKNNLRQQARAAIRKIVSEGRDQGLPAHKIAKEIEGTIGLDERRARAHNRFADEIAAKPGLTDAQRKKAIDKDYAKRLASRAKAIARTELAATAAEAQIAIWESAVDNGTLNPKLYVREWLRIPAAKPCPICGPLHKKHAPIKRGVYVHPKTGKKYRHPPGHTNCECGERLVLWHKAEGEELALAEAA